jgi:hypothetical protein
MRLIIFLSLTVFTLNIYGTHITQAHFEYAYTGKNANGDNKYQVILLCTRECKDGATEFPSSTTFGVYNKSTGKLYISVEVQGNSSLKGPDCLQQCREKIWYETIIVLPTNQDGYYVSNEACCRIPSTNLRNDQNGRPAQGTTSYCYIPGNISNSSPSFSIAEIRINPARTDTIKLVTNDREKDSIVVSLIQPRTGGSIDINQPAPGSNFNISGLVEYNSGFSSVFPLGNSSVFKLDPSGKNLIVQCTTAGDYFVAFEITEFRNGIMVGKTSRETVVTVSPNPLNGKHHVRGWGSLDFPIAMLQWYYCLNNAKYHIVEKSKDSVNYKVIDTLEPEEHYLVDNDVTWSRIYHYRVRSVLHDNSVVSSDTAIVKFWGMDINQQAVNRKLVVYPVPVSNACAVSMPGAAIDSYTVSDHSGRIIENLALENDVNSFEIDCSLWAPGVYFIQCTSSDGIKMSQKMLKQ